jgi:hypothetical protein
VSSLGSRWLPVSLVLVVIAYYFWFLYQHALNVPYEDDLYDVLQVISHTVQADSQQAALGALYEQHNDHRTIASRAVYYVSYLVGGEVNFRTLTFLANMGLVAIFFLFYSCVRPLPNRWLLMLPCALVLFQLRAYELVLWSMAAFAFFYVFLYGFLCIHLLHNVTRLRFLLAVIVATLGSFTLASGQVIWLIGLLSLLHQSFSSKRLSTAYAIWWAIAAVAILLLWRWGFNVRFGSQMMLGAFLDAPVHHIHYFLALLGSAASASNLLAATLVGAVLFTLLVFFGAKSFALEDVRLELFCWYIVLTVVALTLGRAFLSEVNVALVSRHSFPSVLMLCTIFLLIAVRSRLKNNLLLSLVMLAAGVYAIHSYGAYSLRLQPSFDGRIKAYNRGNYPGWYKPQGETSAIVKVAEELNIYNPPQRPIPLHDLAVFRRTRVLFDSLPQSTEKVSP